MAHEDDAICAEYVILVIADGSLHIKGGVTRPYGMVLVGQWRAKKRYYTLP